MVHSRRQNHPKAFPKCLLGTAQESWVTGARKGLWARICDKALGVGYPPSSLPVSKKDNSAREMVSAPGVTVKPSVLLREYEQRFMKHQHQARHSGL